MELGKMLVQIANTTHGRISPSQTFSDFVAYSALTLSIRTDPVHAEKRRGMLKKLKDSYKDTEWNSFHEGLVALSREVVKNNQMGNFIDLFALPYTQIGAASKELKQDFTPPDVAKLIAVTKKYTRIDELTPEVLNAFVDKIVVHEREKKDGKRTQQIDIHYSYVGIVDIPTDEEMREMEQEYMQRTTRQTA